MKSAILEKGEKYYTYLKKVFNAIENEQIKFNWLITNCECYPKNEDLNELFSKEYVWISGEKLTDAINKEDIQFIWGVFSGFSKDITLKEILMYDLPFADGNERYWVDNVVIQHPLANIEIVAWDSTLTMFISRDNELVQRYMNSFPLAKDLSAQNAKQNTEIAYIEELLTNELNKRNIRICQDLLFKKYTIWNKLYYKKDNTVEDKDIIQCIMDVLKLKEEIIKSKEDF